MSETVEDNDDMGELPPSSPAVVAGLLDDLADSAPTDADRRVYERAAAVLREPSAVAAARDRLLMALAVRLAGSSGELVVTGWELVTADRFVLQLAHRDDGAVRLELAVRQ